MQCTFDQLQDAFIKGRITFEQFIEVLVDNFGAVRAKKIIDYNIDIALKKEKSRQSPSETL